MASKLSDFTTFENDTVLSDEMVALQPESVMRLRKTDVATGLNFDPNGTFKQGTALLPNLVAKEITELVGFETEEEFDLDIPELRKGNKVSLGTIDYQISKDNGSTYLHHDGFNWVAAGAGDFNTRQEVDLRLTELSPLPERQIRFKVRITPSADGKHTPKLKDLVVHYEVRMEFIEDFKRSLKRHLDNNLAIRMTDRITMPSTSTSFTLSDIGFTIDTVIGVFNETSDPGLVTDLFSSLLGNTITMTASQTAGDVIVTKFEGKAPIFLSADEDFQLSEIPAIVIEVPVIVEDRGLRLGSRKLDRQVESKTVRERLQRLYQNVTVQISCLDRRETGSIRMAQELSRLFQYEKFFVSEASGQDFTVLAFQPMTADDRVSTGLFVKQVTLTVSGQLQQEEFEAGKLADAITTVFFNTELEKWEDL